LKCVFLQPSYIPWRGYFDQIYQADIFVFFDNVQYDKRGWRNRNRIKTPHGVQWLTIPVHSKGAQTENISINQIHISWDRPWNEEHWKTLKMAYTKAPYFKRYAPLLESFYATQPEMLSDFAIETTIALANELGITHPTFMRSSSLGVPGSKTGNKTDRLINILNKLGATTYITGPSAKDYIEPEKFQAAQIKLLYMSYNYIEYPQLYPPYDPQVSILDLLLMTGPDAMNFIIHSKEK
jgi:WbqC-like protein family